LSFFLRNGTCKSFIGAAGEKLACDTVPGPITALEILEQALEGSREPQRAWESKFRSGLAFR
tara:strand:+ start:337 stop:522 length:186 start_codon:yes stop_codon:yes gene_type:complete